MKKAIYHLAFYLLTLVLTISCASDPEEKSRGSSSPGAEERQDRKEQWNITILLDLSDRIEPTKYPESPEHYERDIEIINYFTELFKQDMQKKGAYMARGKMKVIFSPRPRDEEINTIASELSIDLSRTENVKEKKEIFDNVSAGFRGNLEKIYAKTIETKNYIGSDIWRFFKNDVVDYCIDADKNYRNVLVILTDGYLFHKDSRDREGNRTAALLPETLAAAGLRNNDWKKRFENGDYGFIHTRSDLEDLEVLVLEISPVPDHRDDEDVIKAYWSQWLEEMNVRKYELYNSDLPEYTRTRIEKFILQT